MKSMNVGADKLLLGVNMVKTNIITCIDVLFGLSHVK